jgi:hypothetical protein
MERRQARLPLPRRRQVDVRHLRGDRCELPVLAPNASTKGGTGGRESAAASTTLYCRKTLHRLDVTGVGGGMDLGW